MRVAALVLGAGRGERLGYAMPKAFVPLAGRALIAHALEALASTEEVEWVVPVIPADAHERFAGLVSQLRHREKLGAPVVGGAERQDSVAAGLDALPKDVVLVAVHDAARPLVRPADVSRVIAGAWRCGAAILAVPVRDTIKRVREGRVLETPPRAECWAAQTPQVFRVELLREAHAKAEAEGRLGTDCAQLVEALGIPVEVVEGDPGNLKITLPEDLERAERALEERR
ncbi:MAG TPA: 2-C-methyl-D-erythritol 4-phosphate cytidylyltransferase [Myxococcota bacterium]